MGLLATNKADFIKSFLELNDEVEDSRQDSKLLYPLNEIVFLVISGVLAGAESWRQIYNYGIIKLEFLRQYFPYQNGIPCKSTICGTMGIIEHSKFELWLYKWTSKFFKAFPGEIINIDGKSVKGSRTKNSKATHILNVFANAQGMILAQRTVDKKTNEISELPELINDLNIEGATVTIDAIGCQTAITGKITEKNANYFIGLKGNQPSLYDAGRYLFVDKDTRPEWFDYYSERNRGHGRIERRKCWIALIPDWFKEQYSNWSGLQSICLIESERHIIGGKRSIEQRFYISSETLTAKQGFDYARAHWSIENKVHYVLDVTFKEDASHIHNAAENMSVIRKIVLNLINKYKKITKSKCSTPSIRKQTGWSATVANDVLGFLLT